MPETREYSDTDDTIRLPPAPASAGMGGYIALGLLLFMGLVGIYEIWVDKAYLGGGIWLGSAIVLLPPIQSLLRKIGLRIPAQVSLLIFVGGFMAGLLALNQSLKDSNPVAPNPGHSSLQAPESQN